MKKLILLLLVIAPFITMAQKNKLKDVEIGRDQMPAQPLQGDFKTYSVVVISPNLSTYGMSSSTLAKTLIKLEKYKLVESNGDFEIAITIGKPTMDAKLNEQKKAKEKDGKKTTWTEYSYNLSYQFPVRYKIYDGKRDLMIEEIVSGSDFSKKKIGTYNNLADLKKEYAKQRTSLLSGSLDYSLGVVRNNIIRNHDHRYVKGKTNFYTISRAKKKGLQSFEDAFQTAKATCLTTINGKQDMDGLTKKMESALATWEKGLNDFSPTEKKQRQVYEAAGYNLARFYIITGEFDKAEEAVKKLSKNPKSKDEVSGLNKDIKYYKGVIEANKDIPMTFVGQYVAGSVSPGEIASRGGNYIVMKSGESIYGKPTFAKTGPVSFVNLATNAGSKKINVSEIDKIIVGDKTWIPAPVRQSKSWVTGIAEVLESNDHIKCYKQDLGGVLELVKIYLLKKGSKTPIDVVTIDMMTDFNNKLAAKFSNCPVVANKLKNGEYDASTEERDMINIAKDYAAADCK